MEVRKGDIQRPGQREFQVGETANTKTSKVEACLQGLGSSVEVNASFVNILFKCIYSFKHIYIYIYQPLSL